MNKLESRTLALAGMFQAATLVDELALHGHCHAEAFDCSIDSLFTIDAASTEEALGQVSQLSRGLEALSDYLGGENRSPGRNIAYYLLSILKISTQVLRNPALAEKLLEGLGKIENSAKDFEMSRGSVINKIDGLYQDCISSLNPRIIVRGDQNYLRNTDNAAKIRGLLLAGIRAAVLWQQLGGNKWNLFWLRKKYVYTARMFLRQG
ncbi:MAG: high frequency lysogenization protein HflD [Gammaproteobacteria bacterium]|nr:high frequency lysogenization protein HflD [Gammaproteobacteria bacterium]